MLTDVLTTQFRMTDFIAQKNLEGITHEESLVRAADTGTHINWIVGHIVGIRNRVLPSLNQQPVWDADTTTGYCTGLAGQQLLPFDEIVRAFHESTERLIAGVAQATDADYASKAPFSPGNNPDETLGTLLMKCTVHEGYHLGQTGILRRVAGKEGAIRM